MKVSDLSRVPDPLARFVQTQKFIASLEASEAKAVEIRSGALLELRSQGYTLQAIADLIGVTKQRVGAMEKRAKEYHG
jgi:transcriptional regulator